MGTPPATMCQYELTTLALQPASAPGFASPRVAIVTIHQVRPELCPLLFLVPLCPPATCGWHTNLGGVLIPGNSFCLTGDFSTWSRLTVPQYLLLYTNSFQTAEKSLIWGLPQRQLPTQSYPSSRIPLRSVGPSSILQVLRHAHLFPRPFPLAEVNVHLLLFWELLLCQKYLCLVRLCPHTSSC